MSQWLDIATAPQDGKMIMLARKTGSQRPKWFVYIGRFSDGRWITWPGCNYGVPTHWMPLPAPPTP